MNNISRTLLLLHATYKYLIKPILFLFDAEAVHTTMVKFAEDLGQSWLIKLLISPVFVYKHNALAQTIEGLSFLSPIGLAAGFDYEARLTQVLPSIGFGFETVGTITNSSYEGNTRPMLGRLPKSHSLMVNKGFKNLGAAKTISRLKRLRFVIPIGISIGRTNTLQLKNQKQSVSDITDAFKLFEKSVVAHSYYELNISCPNLHGDITFYPSKNLEELLSAVDKLKLSRPLFVKMPIEKSDAEVSEMLRIIAQHSPTGVIFGNLQKDHNHPSLDQTEVKKFTAGHFSGKPTFVRSNQLIELAYRRYKKRFIIIGTGGVFSAEDAYTKIKLGASLVQLITGMIYEGPQLIAQINRKLVDLMEKDGYTHISQAIGAKHRKK